MIIIRNLLATAAVTACLLCAPAMADQNYETRDLESSMTLKTGLPILFHEPVAIEGVIEVNEHGQRTVVAENGMHLEIPAMALVWNGDRNIFLQDTEPGDNIVVHLRSEEPYRVLGMDNEIISLGSYDGVFVVSQELLEDIDLDSLDNDIYAENEDRTYDYDLGDDDNNFIIDTEAEEQEALMK